MDLDNSIFSMKFFMCLYLIPLWSQSFKCNNLRVLNRSPRCGSTLDDATSCNNGSRKSKEAKAYQYCSITCMVTTLIWLSQPFTVTIHYPSDNSLHFWHHFLFELSGESCKEVFNSSYRFHPGSSSSSSGITWGNFSAL
jgi:hypothetical protein